GGTDKNGNLMIAQIYVDDIIFGGMSNQMVQHFVQQMSHLKLQHLITSRVLELLHMDLMGPMQVESLGGKRYVFVMVDDFSRFTWVDFLREKSDTFEVFKDLYKQLQREKDSVIVRIRSDHGKEFENAKFLEFCSSECIKHEFSSPITPRKMV
ncbi:retrovirus-related pol polyprotein from transposon tnt 1-94, partial [Trifolium medium]|nr:retrovirus-related pol polyprotein from transposon tnt 1-94 [Trifolium medium]